MSPEGDADVPEDAPEDAPSSAKPKAKVTTKRDPNEPVPNNWQRRPHLADRILQPDLSEHWELSSDQLTLKSESLSLAVGDHVFVSPSASFPLVSSSNTILDSPIDHWDVQLPSFRIARITRFSSMDSLSVQWLVRPAEIQFKSSDTREVYLANRHSMVNLLHVRGKATVQHRLEVRNLSKYREKSACFWFDKYLSLDTFKLWDVLPVSAIKSFGSAKAAELSSRANYAVVEPNRAEKLTEAHRKRKSSEAEDNGEPSVSDEDLAKMNDEKLRQPFRYLDTMAKNWSEWPKIRPRIGEQYQVEISDWPGQPLVYYTWTSSSSNSHSKVRKLVEPISERSDSGAESLTDECKPWVQEMPSGYLSRGGSATCTTLSLPHPNLTRFVTKCQESYVASLKIEPYNLQFLDECCAAFTSADDENKALVTVSLLSHRQLVPSLNAAELQSFWYELNPFLQKNWHSIYRAVGSKPMAELCQYYWVSLPFQPHVSPDRFCLTYDIPDRNVCCVVCHTDNSPDWHPLPGFVHIPNNEVFDEKSLALCTRCARLWYRYNTSWLSSTQVFKALDNNVPVDPELVEDAKVYTNEQDRRTKKRQVALEKRETTVQKKMEAKENKRKAKELANKDKQESKTSRESNEKRTPSIKDDISAGRTDFVDNDNELTTDLKPTEKSDKKNLDKQLNNGKEPKPAKKRKKKETLVLENGNAKDNNDDDGSTTEESDSAGRTRISRKLTETQLSLDIVDEILASIDENVEQESAEVPNYCCVCGQLDPSMAQLTCSSCNLNVHVACYGHVDMNEDAAWICDCCLNSRGRLPNKCDQTYQCELCTPRIPSYASWLMGSKIGGAPDVLKPTLDKSWCHLRCAVWTPNVMFSDPAKFSGIDLSRVRSLINNQRQECCVCADKQTLVLPTLSLGESNTDSHKITNQQSTLLYKYMGTKVKCELCDARFHVSCAVDHNCQIGFNQSGPVIICSKHSGNSQLTPMSKLDLSLQMTKMQMFVSTHKVSNTKHMSSKERVKLTKWKELSMQALGSTPLMPLIIVNNSVQKMFPPITRCSTCQTAKANYWHQSGDSILCSQCYRGISSGSRINFDFKALLNKLKST